MFYLESNLYYAHNIVNINIYLIFYFKLVKLFVKLRQNFVTIIVFSKCTCLQLACNSL